MPGTVLLTDVSEVCCMQEHLEEFNQMTLHTLHSMLASDSVKVRILPCTTVPCHGVWCSFCSSRNFLDC